MRNGDKSKERTAKADKEESKTGKGHKNVKAGILCGILLLSALPAGCGRAEGAGSGAASEIMQTETVQAGAEQETTQTDAGQQEITQTDATQKQPPEQVEFTFVEENPVVEDNSFTFGALKVTIPQNATVELREREDGKKEVYILSGNESDIWKPEGCLLHYRAKWQDKKSLVYALLSLLEADWAAEKYQRTENKMYYFTVGAQNGLYRVLVVDEDLYIASEPYEEEGEYSVRYLQGMKVKIWDDMSIYYSTDDKKDAYPEERSAFYKKAAFAGREWLFMALEEAIFLYGTDDFKTAWQVIEDTGSVSFSDSRDMNFDGVPELFAEDGSFFYWDDDAKQFMPGKVEVGDYAYSWEYGWDCYGFADTKTIWMSDTLYEDSTFKTCGFKESLWQWEDESLIMRREYILMLEAETVHASVYGEGGEAAGLLLAEADFDRGEWEKDPRKERVLYKEFYEGFAPEEIFYLCREAVGDTEYIPQAFLDKISAAMLSGTERATLQKMENERELTEEEENELIAENQEVRSDITYADGGGDCFFISADGDNDGISDIMAEVYSGGSGGFTNFIFYKGTADGEFVRTSSYAHIMEGLSVISFEGKNYLCRTVYDYGKKKYQGVALFCYEDGVRREEVHLFFVPEEVDVAVTECGAYREYAEWAAEECISVYNQADDYEVFYGSAETPVQEEGVLCDIDNDGIAESYSKSIWTASNMSTTDTLMLLDNEDIGSAKTAFNEAGGRDVQAMWVNTSPVGNIMNVMVREDLYGFSVTGYLVKESDYQVIYRIEGTPKLSVEQRRIYMPDMREHEIELMR